MWSLQPYIEQAAQDKARAEEEKAAYDVRIPHRMSYLRVTRNTTGQ